jgi:DNA-binding GntR family transcriptional regulator
MVQTLNSFALWRFLIEVYMLNWVGDHPSFPEKVYSGLREQIFEGVFRPGQMLRQDDIARRLGISRAPVREAFPRLEAEGLLVLYPRRGYAVASLDPAEIAEVFRLRELLEGDAATVAVARRTTADISVAQALRCEMATLDTSDSSQRRRWFEVHSKFHHALISPSGLKHYERLTAGLSALVESYIRIESSFTGGVEQADAEHDALLQAFAQDDAEHYSRLIVEHVRHTAQRLLSLSHVPM